MLSTLLISGLTSLGLSVLAYSILKLRLSQTASAQSEFSKILADGVSTYSKRISSNVLQILVYLITVILIFSYGFDKPFPSFQLLAAVIGGLSVLSGALIQFYLFPRLLERMINASDGYPRSAMLEQFIVANGLSAVYLGLIGFSLLSCVYFLDLSTTIGFGLGTLLAGYFIRMGGGLFKASSFISNESASIQDGKIPRYDSRNPGTYTEVLGITSGSVLGVESDLVSSLIFAISAGIIFGLQKSTESSFAIVPLIIFSISFFSSICSVLWGYYRIKFSHYSNVFLEGIYITVSLSAIATYFIFKANYGNGPEYFLCYLTGLIGAIFIGFSSEVLTSFRFKFTRTIARQGENGPLHIALKALENSFFGNGLIFVFLGAITTISFMLSGPFGLALSAMGMLSVIQSILSANFSLPISNAVFRISELLSTSHIVAQNVKKAEQLAGTTVAIRNGFASGAALLSTLSLITALLGFHKIELTINSFTHLGFLIPILAGLAVPYVCLSFILRGMQSISLDAVGEIHRQYREFPFLRAGKSKVDVIRAVEQISRGAMDTLIIPGMLMLFPPILIAYFGSTVGLLGFALGVFFSSFNCTFLWGNFGDSLQQARAFIETGHMGGRETRTFDYLRSADHHGSVYRDVLSPGINMILKSICMIVFLLVLST